MIPLEYQNSRIKGNNLKTSNLLICYGKVVFLIRGINLKSAGSTDQFTPGLWPSVHPLFSDEKASSVHDSKSDCKFIRCQGIFVQFQR